MAKSDVTTKDRERFERARARGALRARDGSAVVSARYNARGDTLDLRFRGGGSMVIPRTLVPGLGRLAAADLDAPVVSPAGDALCWPNLDLDVYVPGLVARICSPRQLDGRADAAAPRRRLWLRSSTGRRVDVRVRSSPHRLCQRLSACKRLSAALSSPSKVPPSCGNTAPPDLMVSLSGRPGAVSK